MYSTKRSRVLTYRVILINDTCLLDRVPETMSTDLLKYKQGRSPFHSHIVKIRLIFDIVGRDVMSQ